MHLADRVRVPPSVTIDSIALLMDRSAGRVLAMGGVRQFDDLGDLAALDRQWAVGVGLMVRGRLAENERTQHDAARVLGLSQAAVNRRIKGQTAFSITELARISLWLNVPIPELLPRKDSNLQPADYRMYWRDTSRQVA